MYKKTVIIVLIAAGLTSLCIYRLYNRNVFNQNRTVRITHLKVKKNGRLGVDCDFTSITTAILLIDDNSSSNRYVLDVAPGFYPEPGPSFNGLELKDFIDIAGTSSHDVVITNLMPPGNRENQFATINRVANCTVKNVCIISYKTLATINASQHTPRRYVFTLSDCILDNRDAVNRYNLLFKSYHSQSVIINNCQFKGCGIKVQQDDNASGGNLTITGSKLDTLVFIGNTNKINTSLAHDTIRHILR